MLVSPASGAQQGASSPPTAQKPDPISEELATIPAQPDSAEANSDLIRRRFELIRQLVPGIARIAVLWQPSADSALATLQYAGKAASTAGVSLQFFGAGDFSQLEEAVSDISTGEVHAILVMPDPMLTIEHKYIVQSIAKTRLPAIYAARVFVEDGGLMSYGPYLNGLRPHRSPHLEKILDKLNPTGLPVEQLTKFEFVINLKTAKALGIEVPPTLFSRVDEVIE
jgi:putative ABC transport system substrate-binding protein